VTVAPTRRTGENDGPGLATTLWTFGASLPAPSYQKLSDARGQRLAPGAVHQSSPKTDDEN